MNCCCNCAGREEAKAYRCRYEMILNEMIEKMGKACLTESLSHNFIVRMIPHHEAAIEMSRNLLCYPTVEPLEKIAKGIIAEQTQSIADMREILCECGKCENSEQERYRYECEYRRITETMFREMREACTDANLNASFMREMIPHHVGAIRMSRSLLRYPICGGLVPILDAIIRSQEKGVCEMQKLLECCKG